MYFKPKNFTYQKKKKTKIRLVVWKRVVTRRPRGGEKERGRENQPEIHIFRPNFSLYSTRDPAETEIRPSASDLTSATSSTSCPDPIVPFPSPVLVASRREKKKNEREGERERERERDEVERDLFFEGR
jgi:hypothetical protein